MHTRRSALSHEAALLLVTAGGEANEVSLRRLIEHQVDWLKLELLAERERATPILWRLLQRVGEDRLPRDVVTAWRKRAMIAEFQALHQEQSLHGAVRTLAAHGIDVMLLKGSALAYTAYPAFADRPMGDVDILVHPECAQEAWVLLQAHGWIWPSAEWPARYYAAHQHLPPLRDSGGAQLRLEVHTDIMPAGHPFGTSPATLWSDATRVRLNGCSALAPGPVHQLLHLCIHFAWSHQLQWGGWRAFRDVHALAHRGAFPWPEFVGVANESRAATCCYWTLRLARALSGAPVPDDVLQALHPPRGNFLLDRLEHHYALQLFPAEHGCPSVTLSRRLWSVGMAPRWSGHGSVRPWTMSDEWPETANRGSATDSWTRRLASQAQHVAGSLAYLWQMRVARGASQSS